MLVLVWQHTLGPCFHGPLYGRLLTAVKHTHLGRDEPLLGSCPHSDRGTLTCL